MAIRSVEDADAAFVVGDHDAPGHADEQAVIDHTNIHLIVALTPALLIIIVDDNIGCDEDKFKNCFRPSFPYPKV